MHYLHFRPPDSLPALNECSVQGTLTAHLVRNELVCVAAQQTPLLAEHPISQPHATSTAIPQLRSAPGQG
jgi:hypothetical protein